jgi:dUTP pyrophosphatase|tara:strand:+ start:1780 stop:2211 length:432 start_codon:yes stop_codon:yes gene_type:complete
MMTVRVINKSDNDLPNYETIGSAGCDVRSTHSEIIYPGSSVLIKTGLFVEIPIGYEIQVRPRSGLAFKKKLTVLNSPGTIDADYRGEIGVILINHGTTSATIEKGDRIGQLVLNKVEQIEWNSVLVLTDTDRGKGGFGSTGKQ